jgi:dihydropteroate synthase
MTRQHSNLEQVKLMGVLNITPDSFSDGGLFVDEQDALNHARLLLAAGANIIDVGGESTRPGAQRISTELEQERVISVIRRLVDELGALVSVDTMNSETAAAAIEAGAEIINDVSGGLADPNMFSVAAASNATIVISHWRGFSDQMDSMNNYESIAKDVAAELQSRVDAAIAAGVSRENIIIDPGLGFAKDMKQNWQLVSRLDELEKLGLPILVGASRKRFIAGALDNEHPAEVSTERRDVATAVLTALLMQRKLWGLRVHNVLASADAIKLVAALRDGEGH